ncbi:MAG: sugar ABC transporter ATP-binding protein [Planctomycetes bacterium]|nr:sugar ABC transporter ATP-binding protein [Planctomycetota bacterium]
MEPILEAKGITKRFPGVTALLDVDFDLYPGELHAICGENGAGKSTLIRVLSGDHAMDEGAIRLWGAQVNITSPHDAKKNGLHTVPQHYCLIPTMTVAENLFFGRQGRRGCWINWKSVNARARELLEEIGFDDIDVRHRVESISVGSAQKVEIAKVLGNHPRIVIMDEPSASLPQKDMKRLYAVIEKLKQDGVGIIYISHHLEEVFRISDRVTVLKDGRKIATLRTADTDQDEVIRLMVGRDIGNMYPKRTVAPGEPVLTVDSLVADKVKEVSFELREREILGFYGLIGAGRTELCNALFGVNPVRSGSVMMHGADARAASPRRAIGRGFGYVTEDRHQTGLVLTMSIQENISLAGNRQVSRLLFIRKQQDVATAKQYVKTLRIVTPGIKQLVKNLSGGNQQKVVLGKWLFVKPRILILDEPTRGIDVGAKEEIYRLMDALTAEGISIIMVSSDLPEMLQMSDRIIVMREGEVMDVMSKKEASEERVVAAASGLAESARRFAEMAR